jgi:hypothetical protein
MKGKNVLYRWNHQQLFITDRIIDELTPSKISRELEKKLHSYATDNYR